MTPSTQDARATGLVELAERVAAMNDITCPLCGEDDHDVLGFLNHITRWCDVEKVAAGCNRNSDVADALRALAASTKDMNHDG